MQVSLQKKRKTMGEGHRKEMAVCSCRGWSDVSLNTRMTSHHICCLRFVPESLLQEPDLTTSDFRLLVSRTVTEFLKICGFEPLRLWCFVLET
jgi:hypothetical protein